MPPVFLRISHQHDVPDVYFKMLPLLPLRVPCQILCTGPTHIHTYPPPHIPPRTGAHSTMGPFMTATPLPPDLTSTLCSNADMKRYRGLLSSSISGYST